MATSPAVDDLLSDLADRKRRAAVMGVLAGLFLLGLVIAFNAFLRSLPELGLAHSLARLLMNAVMSATPVAGYLIYVDLMRPRGLLLWVRRFRPAYGKRLKFHRALGVACAGLVTPVTVQDRSFSSSMLAGHLRAWWIYGALALIFPIGLIFFVVFPMLAAQTSSRVILLGGALVWFLILALVATRVQKRMGFTTLEGDRGVVQAAMELERLHEGERPLGFGMGVLKCDDEIWQDVVAMALSNARVAVIDLSDVTENVRWEITEAVRRLGKERIVLVCEAGAQKAADELARELIGDQTVVVSYAATEEGIGRARNAQYSSFANRLRNHIAGRLAEAAA